MFRVRSGHVMSNRLWKGFTHHMREEMLGVRGEFLDGSDFSDSRIFGDRKNSSNCWMNRYREDILEDCRTISDVFSNNGEWNQTFWRSPDWLLELGRQRGWPVIKDESLLVEVEKHRVSFEGGEVELDFLPEDIAPVVKRRSQLIEFDFDLDDLR